MKRHFLWILEALVWLLVIVVIVFGVFGYKHLKLLQKHSYHVFFKDTDSLRQGAQVRFLGVEIGHVTNIKIVNNDEIFVSFVVTDDDLNLPIGSTAHIESTGIVGSKSIELYPPENSVDKTSALVTPYSPRRMSNVFETSVLISDLIYMASNMVNKMIDVNQIPTIRRIIHTQATSAEGYDEKIEEINSVQNKYIEQIQGDNPLKQFSKKMEQYSNGQNIE